MKEKFSKTLFIFRRDLRLKDNTGLIFALKESECVIPCFIFTPEQIENNPFKSSRALQFMIESLIDLQKDLEKQGGRLYLFWGSPHNVVRKCITELKIDAVVFNRDYTPYSKERDKKIASTCKELSIFFQSFDDALLLPFDDTLKKNNTPYHIFTPYYQNASKGRIPKPIENSGKNYSTSSVSFALDTTIYDKILSERFEQAKGGRDQALKILKNLENFTQYSVDRNIPSVHGTTRLSAHLKFTTCSVREVYHMIADTLGNTSDLLRALYWRDFFTMIIFYYPHVVKKAFHSKFDGLKWDNDPTIFEKWCSGKTGFPIVDAGMRELNETGYMHNRLRMIVSSFLIKTLHIDWRWGEKYFAQNLIDYDPALNNGNWQWAASTGCDAQPYFRIFNPWRQSQKFDPDCVYIKKWIPELKDRSSKEIHTWYLQKNDPSYPVPIVNHEFESKKTLQAYKSLS